MGIKNIKEVSSKYVMTLDDEDECCEEFDFELVWDREQWVLQGSECCGKGVRYTVRELEVIAKEIRKKSK